MEFIKFCFKEAPILSTIFVAIILGGYICCLYFNDTIKQKVRAVILLSLCLVGFFVYTWIINEYFLIILFVMFICYPILRIFGGAIIDLFRYFFRL